MTSRDFVYWLQGHFELSENPDASMDCARVALVRKHLALVFKHEIDPSYGNKEHQDALKKIHHPVLGPLTETLINC